MDVERSKNHALYTYIYIYRLFPLETNRLFLPDSRRRPFLSDGHPPIYRPRITLFEDDRRLWLLLPPHGPNPKELIRDFPKDPPR